MTKANYEILESAETYVLIKDIGPWDEHPTVTNDADAVVSEMAPILKGRHLLYIDSEGHKAELLVKQGNFAGYAPFFGASQFVKVIDVIPEPPYPYPDIGKDPLKFHDEAGGFEESKERLQRASSVQQKLVPDQTALVWRIDLQRLLDDHTWRKAVVESLMGELRTKGPDYGPIATKARDIAMEAPKGQFRRDGKTPYFTHVEAVARKLFIQGEDDETVAVGFLHDILEDTKVTRDELTTHGFSEIVTFAVCLLTNEKGFDYGKYISGIGTNPIAFKVKFADMTHNLSDNPSPAQIIKYANGLICLMAHV